MNGKSKWFFLVLLEWVVGAVALSVAGRAAAAEVTLVEQGMARGDVIVGEGAPWADGYAASQLVRYIRKMSGATLRVLEVSSGELPNEADGRNLVVIGQPGTNPLLDRVCSEQRVSFSPEALGTEGFLIRTTGFAGRNILILGGADAPGVQHAVYEFLEDDCNVGFFRYEEVVHNADTIRVKDLDRRGAPCFAQRPLEGQLHYWGVNWWDRQDWLDEYDWMVKKGFNYLGKFGPPEEAGQELFYKRIGLDVKMADPSQYAKLKVRKQLAAEMQKRGLQPGMNPYFNGKVHQAAREAFKKKYPGVRTFINPAGGGWPDELFVHPKDPRLIEFARTGVEFYRETYGGSRYYSLPVYHERFKPKGMRGELADVIGEYVNAIAPDGWWIVQAWMFHGWQKERVRKYLENIPQSVNLTVWNLAAETQHLYKKFDYWYGRDWVYIPIHTMAFDSFLTGDVRGLVADIEEILSGPHAEHLVGIGYMPEVRDYAPLYTELVTRLMRQPKGFDFDRFLANYCLRRYGAKAAPRMVEAHRPLIETVYGPLGARGETYSGIYPIYQRMMAWFWFEEMMKRGEVKKRAFFVTRLRQALDIALSAGGEVSDDNLAYRRDLVDMSRSYVHHVFNQNFVNMITAYRQKNREVFDSSAEICVKSLQALLPVISTLHDTSVGHLYTVEDLIDQFRESEFARTHDTAAIRYHLANVTFGGLRIQNYHHHDRYEKLRDYYLPRVEGFVRILVENWNSAPRLPKGELSRMYGELLDRWEREDTAPVEDCGLSTVEAAHRLLRELDAMGAASYFKEARRILKAGEVTARLPRVQPLQKDSVVLQSDMSAGTTEVIPDASGRDNNGRLLGEPRWFDSPLGRALALDGRDDCVIVPDSNSLKPSDLTVEVWFRLDGLPGPSGTTLLWKNGRSGYCLDIEQRYGSLSYLSFNVAGKRGAAEAYVEPGKWHHALATYNGGDGEARLYLDGRLAGRAQIAGSKLTYADGPSGLYVGRRPDVEGKPAYLKGAIAGLHVYGKAFPEEQIQALCPAAGYEELPPGWMSDEISHYRKLKINLVENPHFDRDTAGWTAQQAGATSVFLGRTAASTWRSTGGSLVVTLRAGDEPAGNHQVGAYARLKKPIPKGTSFRVRFAARSIGSSKTLSVTRLHGGAPAVVRHISTDWQQYEGTMSSGHEVDGLLFCTIEDLPNGHYSQISPAADGEFLLDDVTVEVAD